MFTGLIQAVGTIRSVEPLPGGGGGLSGVRLAVAAPGWDHRPTLGESIAVSGCCLTVAQGTDGLVQFDVVRETLSKTTLGGLGIGARVNLERSLRVGDLMGGHIVQGHVDGVGVVDRVHEGGAGDCRVWVRPGQGLMKYMIPKGSICIDGVSLTLAEVDPSGVVQVALIPTTLAQTTLGDLRSGSRVNIEADVHAKTIVHYLEHFGGNRS